tara:strand:- start:18 stop:146 length:129 start_codon:yes stop_codon:yes gene_type:complete
LDSFKNKVNGELKDNQILMKENVSTDIPIGAKHSLPNDKIYS